METRRIKLLTVSGAVIRAESPALAPRILPPTLSAAVPAVSGKYPGAAEQRRGAVTHASERRDAFPAKCERRKNSCVCRGWGGSEERLF